jgi:hypothetical protein
VGLLRKTIQSIQTRQVRVEDWYILTSAPQERLPAQKLLKTIRARWEVENSLHFVKDYTLQEDRHYSKQAQQGSILATLRNLTVNLWNRDFDNTANKPIQSLKFLLNPFKALQFLSSA